MPITEQGDKKTVIVILHTSGITIVVSKVFQFFIEINSM